MERIVVAVNKDVNTTSTIVLDVIQGSMPVGNPNPPGGEVGSGGGGVIVSKFNGLKEALKVKLCWLRQEISGGSIEILGIELSGLEDAVVMCAQYFPLNSYQCIANMMIMSQITVECE